MPFFDQYNLIPNRKGVFKKIKEIYGDEEANSIPEIINPIYQRNFGKELDDILIHRDINYKFWGIYPKKKLCRCFK